MELNPDDIKIPEDKEPMVLFTQSIKSERTRYVYECKLRQILCKYMVNILSGKFEERVVEILDKGRKEPKWTCGLMVDLTEKLRARTKLQKDDPKYLSPTSIEANFAPLKKLFAVNDVSLPWKYIHNMFPEMEMYETRGWSRDEIRRILRHARGAIDRAIILVMASSGVRIGGMELKWKHIIPLYGDDTNIHEGGCVLEEDATKPVACAKLSVYANYSAKYTTFITPEAYEAVLDYRAVWTREAGREPKPNDPFLKKAGPSVTGLTCDGIKQRVYKAIWSAGLRGSEMKEGKRYNVPGMNGFRRFCNKTMKDTTSADSPISSLTKKERILGHSDRIKLDKNYYKSSWQELAREYLSVVPSLTIHEDGNRKSVDSQKDAGTKSNPVQDHGTTISNTGGTQETDTTICNVCGRMISEHGQEGITTCMPKVFKQLLSQSDSSA